MAGRWARALWVGWWCCWVGTAHAQALSPPRLLEPAVFEAPDGFAVEHAHAVKVRITLDEQGDVQRVEVLEATSEQLTWTALGAGARLRFEPARLDGQPVPVALDFVFRVVPPEPTPVPAVSPGETPTSMEESVDAGMPAAPDAGVAAEVPPARIIGTVRTQDSGAPLEGAEVYVECGDDEPRITSTDATGMFVLEDVPPGRRVLAVTATDHVQLSYRLNPRPGETLSLDLVVEQRQASRFTTLIRSALLRVVSTRVGAITVVGEKDLRMQAPQSGNEVIRQVTGLHVRDEEGMGLRLNVGFRGMDPTRSRKTLILEDGVPVTLNPYSEPEAYYTPPIERMRGLSVEKGADSILQGPQTVGGVINYLTADPPEQRTVLTEIRGGSYGYWMAHVMAGDSLGPVAWRVDLAHRAFPGPRRLDLQLLDGTLKVRWQPAAHSRFTLKVNAYDEFSRSTYLGLTTPQYRHNWQDNFAIHDSFNLRRYAGTLHAEQVLPGGFELNAAAYTHHIDRTWRRQNFDRYPRDIEYERQVPGRPGAVPRSDGSSIFFHDERIDRARSYSVAGLQAQFTWRARLGALRAQVIGGSRFHLEHANEERIRVVPVTAREGAVIQREDRGGVGLSTWAQLRVTLWDRLHVSPGVRVESLATQRNVLRTLVADGRGDVKVQDVQRTSLGQQGAVLPSLGVAFDAWSGGVFYAGVHRGWAPSRVKDSLVAIGQNLEVDAELSWNAEAGARLAAGRWLTAEGAVFVVEFENEVVIPSEAGGAAVLIDNATGVPRAYAAPARHPGMEVTTTVDWAELVAAPFDVSLPFTLSTTAGYTFVDARFTGGAFKGRVVPYAPSHVVVARARFEHEVGPYAQVALTGVGSQFADNVNTVEPSVDGAFGELPPYVTVDATAGLRVGVMDCFASVKNVEDQRYIVSRAPRGIMPGSPRMFLAGIRVQL